MTTTLARLISAQAATVPPRLDEPYAPLNHVAYSRATQEQATRISCESDGESRQYQSHELVAAVGWVWLSA
jgi:hypothetical protein